MSIKKKILIIAPHADDEVLGVGGTTHKMLLENNEVHLIVCSKRKNDLPEYTNATEHFTSVCYMGFEDESLKVVQRHLLKNIEKVYNQIKPNIVFIPNKDDFNIDHKVVHEVSEIVVRRYQDYPPEMVLVYEVPSSTTQSFKNNFECNYYVSLTEDNVKFKINNLLLYKNELRPYPNPRCGEGILIYSKFRGMECNSEYAEGFKLIYQKI